MKLLLDETLAPKVAAQLRARGHDVVAVKERPELIGLPDRELLTAATLEHRAIVTENVKDFAALHKSLTAANERHAGLVFTHPRRFPRHARSHTGVLLDALTRFLETTAKSCDRESFIWWLEAVAR